MDLHIVLALLACTLMSTSGWSIPFYPVPSGPHRAAIRMTRFAPPPPPGYRLVQVRAEPDDIRPPRPKRNHDDDYGRDSDYIRDEDYGNGKNDYGNSKNDYGNNKNDYGSNSDDYGHRDEKGITGPVHTFVKTDKNANYKWGVRHHVGNKYAP